MVDENLNTRISLLESRVQDIMRRFDGLQDYYISFKDNNALEQRVAILEREVELVESTINNKVEKTEFSLVKSVVYGSIALILVAVVTTILWSIGLKVGK